MAAKPAAAVEEGNGADNVAAEVDKLAELAQGDVDMGGDGADQEEQAEEIEQEGAEAGGGEMEEEGEEEGGKGDDGDEEGEEVIA